MLELLENLFPILITIIGLFYILMSLLVARAIGYKGLGFNINSSTLSTTPSPSTTPTTTTSTTPSTTQSTTLEGEKFTDEPTTTTTPQDETCDDCLSKEYDNKKSNLIFKQFNIKKNAKIVVWMSFILGCLFLGNQITGYLDFLTSINLIGKIIISIIFIGVGVNARLLIKIFDKIKKNCSKQCNDHLKIDLLESFKKIKATSFVVYSILFFASFFVLFGQKAIKKVSKKK